MHMFSVICLFVFFFLMILRPPRSTRTDTLFPYTTLFRSRIRPAADGIVGLFPKMCDTPAADAEIPGDLFERSAIMVEENPDLLRKLDRKSTRLNSSH